MKIIKGLKKLRNTLTPFPYRSVPGKKVILSQQTLRTNNSRDADDNENRLRDLNNKTKLLEDAKNMFRQNTWQTLTGYQKKRARMMMLYMSRLYKKWIICMRGSMI